MADTNLLILAREFKNLRTKVQEVLKMPVGPQGLQGEKGEQGVKGDIGAPGKNGKDGKDGSKGLDGLNGKDGTDGIDGKDGVDGISVVDARVDFDGSLVLTLSNGTEIDAGKVSSEQVENVYAMLKNGAASLNELLPTQAGNANKYLKTDGVNTSWDTLDGSDINLASPPPIGSTTPAAGTFTTLTATGQTSLGGATDSESMRVLSPAATGTYIQVQSSSSVLAEFRAIGSQANNSLRYVTRGTGNHIFATNNSGSTVQLQVSPTASAVNYVQVTGAATGSWPTISAQGSDASSPIALQSKASGPILFQNGSAQRQFRIDGNGVGFNYFGLTSSATAFAPVFGIASQSGDTNVSAVFQSKGTGAIDLAAGSSGVNISNGGTVTAITRTAGGTGYTSAPSVAISAPTTAGGVQATFTFSMQLAGITIASGGTGYTAGNVLTVSGGTFGTAAQITVLTVSAGVITSATISTAGQYSVLTPSNTVSVTGGTGTGATFNVTWSVWNGGSSSFTITNAGSGYVEQPTVTFSGGGGSGAAAYASVGGVTELKFVGTGTDSVTNQAAKITTSAGTAMTFRQIGGSDTFWQVGAASGTTGLIAKGNANGNALVGANGTGSVRLTTGGDGLNEQLRVTHTASAVNYVQVTGAATGGTPTISAQGSDANVRLSFSDKGSGGIQFNAGGSRQFYIGPITNSVNFIQAAGGTSGNPPKFESLGTDTNIDLTLTPKGTGNVRFGTYTASMALTVQGYIEIKDSGGTVRKLAVIA
jgi:hypothetical protein